MTCEVVSVLLIIPSSPRKRNHWVLVVIWTSRCKRVTASHLIQAPHTSSPQNHGFNLVSYFTAYTHSSKFNLNISPHTPIT